MTDNLYENGYADFYAGYNRKQLDNWDNFEAPWLLPYLPQDKKANITDVGCGQGLLLGYLHRLGWCGAIGIDISSEQVAGARNHPLIHNVVIHGDIFDKALTDKLSRNQEMILCFDMIEHLPYEKLLQLPKLFADALLPGGKVIIRTANADCPIASQGRYIDLTHTIAFTEYSLRQLMVLGGFAGEVVSRHRNKPLWKRGILRIRDAVWRTIYRLWESRPPECCDAALTMIFRQIPSRTAQETHIDAIVAAALPRTPLDPYQPPSKPFERATGDSGAFGKLFLFSA